MVSSLVFGEQNGRMHKQVQRVVRGTSMGCNACAFHEEASVLNLQVDPLGDF